MPIGYPYSFPQQAPDNPYGLTSLGRGYNSYLADERMRTNPISALSRDFLEGNFDVAYESLIPSYAAMPFQNWLRSQRPRYESIYLGDLGRQAAGSGGMPDLSVGQFLSRLFEPARRDRETVPWWT